MRDDCINNVLSLLSSHLWKSNNLGIISLKQIQNLITILIEANIPFQLTTKEETRQFAQSATLTIYVTPTLSITKTFQFDEGNINTC
ncbi:hypothetical protein HZI73_15320 [Vallitalea pronyensis]|uniref:Uncharacterized protein n=1 Tax=Vallitalea pronyensis TaxID=1348613 RepID=A0A8J8MLG0_9FIRM|nr:hypothetical protein [Vallitalea pronyensis]QUI23572.1 hypothetical protein HZI73_15320 [Vallitalea pronyensis]